MVGTQKHVPVQFFADELSLSLDDFSDRILKPAMSVLSSNIAASVGTAMLAGFTNQVGTPGTTPSSFLTFAQAGELLDWQTAPRDGNRTSLVNPTAMAAIADAQKGLFHAASQIEGAFEDGIMDMMTGFKFKMDQSLPTLATGARSTTYTTHGTTVHTSGTATIAVITGTGAMAAGDKFTLAGIYEVNPDTKASTGRLKVFTIATAYGGGAGNITVSQNIYTSGAYQNVSAALPTTTTLVFTGTLSTSYTHHFCLHRDAIVLATADLEIPKGVDMAYRANMDGLSLRFIRDYDVSTDNFIGRFDILYGVKVTRPEWGVAVWGA